MKPETKHDAGHFRPEHSLDCGSMFQREPCPSCEQYKTDERERAERDALLEQTPYPMFCLHPEKCAGRSCCPRDYACSE